MGTPGGVGRAFLHYSMDGMGTRRRVGRASLRFSIVGMSKYCWLLCVGIFFVPDVAYNLTFKTGDMPYAGTDANVTLQLFGDKGQTEKIMLRQESGKTLKRFDRGRTDRFTVQTMDVGKVSESRFTCFFQVPFRFVWFMTTISFRLKGFASVMITRVLIQSGI